MNEVFNLIINKTYIYILFYLMKNKVRAISANKSVNPVEEQSRPKTRYQKFKTDISETDKDIFNRRNRVKQYKYNNKLLTKSRFQEPEKIKEQNLNLKGFINQLQEQLHLQKSIIEMNKKKTHKYVKQFSRQFNKQIYYSGKNPNSYMISGVKQQYENIKQLYTQKCNQLQMCLKDANFTDIEQKNSYIDALQNQNKLLKEKVRHFVEQKQQYADNLFSKTKKRSQIQRLYDDDKKQQLDNTLTNKISQLKIQNQQLQGQLLKLKQTSKIHLKDKIELNKKIQFLQHLIIEKDNNEYKSRLQSKKLLTKINNYQNQINTYINQIRNKQKNYQKMYNQIIQKQTKKYQIQQQIFKKSLYDKNVVIQKLQKQIRYLTTLLSYWKPLDQIDRQMKKQSNNQQSAKQYGSSYFNNNKKQQHKISSELLKSQHQSQHINQFLKPSQHQNGALVRANTQEGNHYKNRIQANRTTSNRNLTALPQHKIRKPQSCLLRYNDKAKKVRRISLQQIKDYTQLAKYRFIGYNYKLNNLNEIFDLKNSNINQEDYPGKTQIISMKQIIKILSQKPFLLNEDGTIAIARFIVEEGSSDFVYLDENNEIQKIIAISILKNLIGQSKLTDPQQIKNQWQNLKNIYLSNIISALKIIAPKGTISKIKLIQLLLGLGIEMSQEFKDWIISTLVIKSDSLNQLQYQVLFNE